MGCIVDKSTGAGQAAGMTSEQRVKARWPDAAESKIVGGVWSRGELIGNSWDDAASRIQATDARQTDCGCPPGICNRDSTTPVILCHAAGAPVSSPRPTGDAVAQSGTGAAETCVKCNQQIERYRGHVPRCPEGGECGEHDLAAPQPDAPLAVTEGEPSEDELPTAKLITLPNHGTGFSCYVSLADYEKLRAYANKVRAANPEAQADARDSEWNAAMEAAAVKIDRTADLYNAYARNPRGDTNVAAMYDREATCREDARLILSLKRTAAAKELR